MAGNTQCRVFLWHIHHGNKSRMDVLKDEGLPRLAGNAGATPQSVAETLQAGGEPMPGEALKGQSPK